MRLKITEYKDLVEIAATEGVMISDLTNWKKRGWVHFRLTGNRDLVFRFHRKKSLQLKDGHFKEAFVFKAEFGEHSIESADWQKVAALFRAWLLAAAD